LTYPGVYIEEVPSGVRTITGVATSIALFIGWAPRGPIDRAVRLTSFADFERTYGGLDFRSVLGYGVKQFYENGGADAYVLRIARTDSATASENAVAASTAIGDLAVAANSPGDWANVYKVRLTRRADDAARFRIDVLYEPANNAVVESFENLSMTASDARFVEAMINGRSSFISVDVSSPAATPVDTTTDLDNTSAGAVGQPIGPADSSFRTTMLAAFAAGGIIDRIDLFNILCVPGLTDATTIQALQTHCRNRRAFMVVDCAEDETVGNAPAALANLTGSDSINSAFYFPWVRAADPLQQGAVRSFPPSGFVAGIYARTDSSRGVWKAPAGIEASTNGAVGLSVTMSDQENGQLNPLAINCLRTLSGYGNVVWGARTLAGNNDRGSEWKYIPVRRMALFIEESLYRGTQWVVFEPNDEPLWAQIRLNIGAFMQNLFRQGAFQGRSPREAYFVKCDRETTTQNDINLGIVNIHVGFAPLKPAEFVVIKLQQMAGQVEA
jgi:phage tail sheath protein FI